jgi:hypothetical protein
VATREASIFQSEAASSAEERPAPAPARGGVAASLLLLLDVVCGGVARSRGHAASEANKVYARGCELCGGLAERTATLGSGGAQGPEAGPASFAC